MLKIKLLRCFAAMCDNDMNVSAAARELRLPQPSVSKGLMDLEKDAGPLFIRRGRRFAGLTPLGEEVLAEARDILLRCENIAALRRRHADGGGDLRIGTTHLQARYVMPPVVRRYLDEFPDARIQIWQGTPADAAAMLENGRVDVAVCTEALAGRPRVSAEPAYAWNRALIVPRKHPLARAGAPTLKKISAFPIVTYVRGFTGRAAFDAAFRRAGLSLNVAVAAADSDVIKTYVRAGAGAGVVAAAACQPEDSDLACVSLSRLFPDMHVYMAFLQDKVVTGSMRRFMDMFREHAAAMGGALGASGKARRPRPL